MISILFLADCVFKVADTQLFRSPILSTHNWEEVCPGFNLYQVVPVHPPPPCPVQPDGLA